MGRSNKNKVSFSNIRTELPAKFAWAALLSEVCFRGSLWQSEAAGLGQACTAMLTVRRFSKRPEKPFCDPQLQSHFDWTWRQCQRLFRPRGVLQVLAFNTQLFASISAGSTNVAQTITPTSDIMFYQWSKYFFFCCYYSVLGLMKANKSKLTAETKKKKPVIRDSSRGPFIYVNIFTSVVILKRIMGLKSACFACLKKCSTWMIFLASSLLSQWKRHLFNT